MIGSLLYLTASHTKVFYSLGFYAQYQTSPKDSHLLIVKKIIKYVSGTMDYGIWYTQDTTSSVEGFCDADWAGNSYDKKRTLVGISSSATTLCLGSVENKTAYHFP